MPPSPTPFADLDPPYRDYDTSRSVILPLPFERTTSWGKGTAAGPKAILEASKYLETWDEELGIEPCAHGIATVAPFLPASSGLQEALAEVEAEARRHLEAGKFLVTLGGEHSLTLPLVRACAAAHPHLGIVQFDAHADLRDEYEGTPFSHACVMRRIVQEDLPTLAVGLRSLSSSEAALIRERNLPVIWGGQLHRAADLLPHLLQALPRRIYLTFDMDYFDPSQVPATGTPEPGGGFWYPTLELLALLFRQKEVVAMDLVELSPIPGQPASDFLAAKLLYKCLGYRWTHPMG